MKILFLTFFLCLTSFFSFANLSKNNSKGIEPLIGTWDKKHMVRVVIGADSTFTAQRWVMSDESYADNFALKGKIKSVNGIKLQLTLHNLTLHILGLLKKRQESY